MRCPFCELNGHPHSSCHGFNPNKVYPFLFLPLVAQAASGPHVDESIARSTSIVSTSGVMYL